MFIDLHTHGISSFDTTTSDFNVILKIAEIFAHHETSAFLPTIYPAPIKTMRENMEAVRKAIQVQRSAFRVRSPESHNPQSKIQNLKSKLNSSLFTPHSSLILGMHLEGPFLNPLRCGALEKESFLSPSIRALQELIEGYEDIIKTITIAPELRGALETIRYLSDRGIIVNMGHSDATFKEAEEGFNAGAKGITHIFNAMRGFHHREPGISGFGLLNNDIYVEVIADLHHLHPEAIKLIFRVKRTERILLISDSIKESKTAGENSPYRLNDGRIAGSRVTITDCIENLTGLGISREIALRCVEDNPAVYLANR
ncbi:MAG: hypothetical protein AB1488_06250 [Nitrospirota bacterium]